MAKLFANSGDPDQMPHFAASDLGLHCLPISLLWVSGLKWVKLFSASLFKTRFLSELYYKYPIYVFGLLNFSCLV